MPPKQHKKQTPKTVTKDLNMQQAEQLVFQVKTELNKYLALGGFDAAIIASGNIFESQLTGITRMAKTNRDENLSKFIANITAYLTTINTAIDALDTTAEPAADAAGPAPIVATSTDKTEDKAATAEATEKAAAEAAERLAAAEAAERVAAEAAERVAAEAAKKAAAEAAERLAAAERTRAAAHTATTATSTPVLTSFEVEPVLISAPLLRSRSRRTSATPKKLAINWKHAVILGAAVVTVGLTCAFLFVPSFAVLTTSLIVAAKALVISGLNIALNGIVAAAVAAKALAISGFSIASANVLAAATVAKTFVASGLAMAANGVMAGFNVALAGIQTLGHVFMPAVSNTVAAVIGSSVIAAGATLVSGAVIGATLLIKSRRAPVDTHARYATTVNTDRKALPETVARSATPIQSSSSVSSTMTRLRSAGNAVADLLPQRGSANPPRPL